MEKVLKPFDLEAAKAGAPIVTRNGRDAKFIAHVPEAKPGHRVIAMIADCGRPFHFDDEGGLYDAPSGADLFMKTMTHKGWINIYENFRGRFSVGRSTIWASKTRALKHKGEGWVATVEIEWEC